MIFKKKPIYIVGIILFTLILIADLAAFFLVPTGGRENLPGMGGGSFNGEMRSGFDPESFGGQMPNGGDFNFEDFAGQMPDGGDFNFEDFAGQMPNGGNFNFEDFAGQMPDGFDGSNMPNRGQAGGSAGGFLGTIRSAFWPILIVCVLGDAACIFMLIHISKKSGKKENEEDYDEDDRPRRDRTNTWLAVIAVILVGAVSISSIPTDSSGTGRQAESAVLEEQAKFSDIVGIFSGSGTLSSSDSDAIDIPVSVTVTSYTVKNGDVVDVGDVIAKVDKNSVLNAIYEVQTLISEMDAEIAEVQSDTLEDEITARADGRVKAIYVEEGDSIASAMYENGAVILISLGGSMTVVIESEQEVTVGEILTVTLSDETQIEGKVQQVRSGKITITTTDDGPAPGDTVTVATEDGTNLGTGTLNISSPLKVTGYFGTVDRIKVSVGDKVEAGDTLVTLDDIEDLARYEKLLLEREELTALVDELNQIYQDGCIKADQSGIISGIDQDAAYTQLSGRSQSGNYASTLSASSSSGSYGIVLLSNTSTQPATTPTEETTPPTEGTTPPTEGTTPPTEGTTPPTEGTTPPNEGTTPPTEGTTPPDGGTTPPGDTTPPAETDADGTFAGKVTKVTYGALQIKISETDMTGSTIAAVETMDEALFTVNKQYAPSLSVPVNMYQNGQTIPSSINAIQAGDKVLIRIEGGTVAQIDFIVGTGMTGPSQGTTPGGNMQFPSGGSNFGGYKQPNAEDEDEEEAVYEVETTTVCAITPADSMTIAVSVDELDILTLAIGQEATITLDALPGQSFSGIVKKINPTGTNEGGSTKYTVTMEVPRTEQMLPGMNGSVLIEVSRLDSVLTVPAAAVYEDGTRTYVYTALDSETGEPTAAVDVTTGASDGTYIQILSGLSDGDAVYYRYADSIVYRNNT